MIIRAQANSFVCIAQHDHAQLSGMMADRWRADYFRGSARRADVELAVYQHDRGWIAPDAAPFWNDARQAPYSFLDYPTPPKIVHYEHGLNETEQLSAYAGLLCSLHYTDFFDPDKPGLGADFVKREIARQQRLKEQLGLTNADDLTLLDFHLQLLKFLDRLSLYLCLNEPGATKADEHPWYRAGIPFSDYFDFARGQLIQAHWLDRQTVRVQPFPFDQPFRVLIRYKQLPKTEISTIGLAECFQREPWQEHEVLMAD